MRKTEWRIGLLVVFLLAVAALGTSPAWARSPQEGKVVWGGEYTLPPGQILQGDLTVIGGKATVAPQAVVTGDAKVIGGTLVMKGTVKGNVTVTGGEAWIDGQVDGDVRLIGGKVHFERNAVVKGKVHVVSGGVQMMSGAQVRIFMEGPQHAFFWPWQHAHSAPIGAVNFLARWLWRGMLAVFYALALAVLAAMLFLFLEGPSRKVIEEIEKAPLVAGGVGLLAAALLPVVLLAMAITLLLLPLALVMAVAVAALGLYGWLVLGLLLGDRLAEVGHVAWHPAVSGAVGTFLLTLVAGLLNIIPCVGWIPGFLAEALGFGAVLLVLWEFSQQHRGKGHGESVVVDAASSEGPTASA
ncbi:MAG TPA: polymer-forming cytoskeletal protein [Chloroflexi bacterium]|nr:polymer-forming cytoskeletal protein [Chloroflexota bacterium]